VLQEYWKRLDELFHAALVLEGTAREEFLAQACGANRDLFGEVWSLISSFDADRSFLEQSAFGAGAKLVVENGGSEMLGRRIGAHKIISELGRGGMGTVYLALRDDEEFQQRVAVKIVRNAIASPSLIDRFRRERQILANLNHPNIARLLDGGTIGDGTPYLVMEYVRGLNVVEYAARNNLSVEERLKLFLKICGALEHAHTQGIIHRDIKPTNVFVTSEGEPKLLDFGIARVLQDSQGEPAQTITRFNPFTPEYSSPEQTRGAGLGIASDIYSLGVLLYELLTKTHPFDFANRSPLEIAQIVCESEPERPSTAIYRRKDTVAENEFQSDESRVYETSRLLRGDLDNIILMAMRKEPSRRYRSAGEFSNDIQNYLLNLPVRARPNSTYYRASKFVKRNRAASMLSALLAVCCLIAPVISLCVIRAKTAEAARDPGDSREAAAR
jgi:serine/threonine protein kinase